MTDKASISIGSRSIGEQQACLIIAEIAQAHDGSLGTAHAYIDAVAAAGAEAIKFQTHIAAAESTPQERFRVQHFPQDESRYDYWMRMEFSAEQWAGLAEHAREKGLIFLSTPFSMAAVELLQAMDVPAWKIGSGEVDNIPMLENIAQTGKPVLLSSGLSTWSELDQAVATLKVHSTPFAMLQCTSSYPCSPQDLGLNAMAEMKQRYNCPVGLSDHSGNIYASMAAISLGAHLIELHTVFSRDCFGPDVASSVTMNELKQVVEGVRFIQTALQNPLIKDTAAASRSELKQLFGKSLVAAGNLSSGHTLVEADVEMKKPGTGIQVKRLTEFLGRVIQRNVSKGEFLEENDFDE